MAVGGADLAGISSHLAAHEAVQAALIVTMTEEEAGAEAVEEQTVANCSQQEASAAVAMALLKALQVNVSPLSCHAFLYDTSHILTST